MLLYCESSGARVFVANTGLSQQGTNYQASVKTWDIVPSGDVGDNSFRSIDVSGTKTNGFSIGITPTIDGEDQPEQTFNELGSGPFQCQAFFSARGARVSATVRTISRTGDVELNNIAAAFVPIRRVP